MVEHSYKDRFAHFFDNLGASSRWIICLLALLVSCLSIGIAATGRDANLVKVQKFCAQVSTLNDSISSGRSNVRALYQGLLNDSLARINTSSERPGDRGNIAKYNLYINSIHKPIPIDCKVLK